MNRRNWILFAGLVVQLLVIVWVYFPRPAATGPETKFAPGFEVPQIDGLVIADGEGKELELTRHTGEWLLEPAGWPADTRKVQDFLDRITGLEPRRLVSRTAGGRKRLKVAAELFNRRVTLHAGGGREYTLFLGTSPGYRTIHVREAGASGVYLVENLSVWEAALDASSWWKREYLDLDPDELTVLELSNRHGRVVLQRDGQANWQRLPSAGDEEAGTRSDAGELRKLVDRAAGLTVTSYLGREEKEVYGLAEPAAELLLRAGEEQRITVSIGAETEEGQSRVVKSSDSPFYVTVNSELLQPFLEEPPGPPDNNLDP